jgi:hypothetical protein
MHSLSIDRKCIQLSLHTIPECAIAKSVSNLNLEMNEALLTISQAKVIGQMWRDSPQDVRDSYKDRAEQEAREHKLNHPQYHYTPRKSIHKKKRNVRSVATMSSVSESSTPSLEKYESLTDLSDPMLPAVYRLEDNVPYHWGDFQKHLDMKLPMDEYQVRRAPAQPFAGNEQYRQMELETPSHLGIDRFVQELLPSADYLWSDLSNDFELDLGTTSS